MTEAQAESAVPAQPPAAQEVQTAMDAAIAKTVAAAVHALLARIDRITEALEDPEYVNGERLAVSFITECAVAIKKLREL